MKHDIAFTSSRTVLFCDNCSCLALAVLDSQYLCAGCLMNAVASCRDGEAIQRITPLDIYPGGGA